MNLDAESRVSVRFFAEDGQELGVPVVLPTATTATELQILCNQLLEKDDDPIPIAFRTPEGVDIVEDIASSLKDQLNIEKGVELVYLPQAVFRVRPVTRCTSSLPGHSEPVISVQFSPNGQNLASGSGDTTVRLWDLSTELPRNVCKGHTNWVLTIAWSPNGKKLASGCKAGDVFVWDPSTGVQQKKLSGHKQWITSLAWCPLHEDPKSTLLASAGKDMMIRIWDTVRGTLVRTLSSHTASVTSIRWGGAGLLYSASQDRTIKVWRTSDGVMCRTLTGHAHWVNTLALNVDYALRTSCFDPMNHCIYPGDDKAQEVANERYQKSLSLAGGREMLVSGSDDFTMFLWDPANSKKEIARLTGHQQLVNHVVFSPDTRLIASAAFDKSIKLWDGRTGKYLTSLRGHVQAVYQISWSADSRLLVSGSADSTLKVWDMRQKKLLLDLPGHGADVFAVDWSPDGSRVVSGGKDCVLKLWRQ